MNPFLNLSPTESILIIEENNTEIKDLVRYTFMELLRQGVLQVKHKNSSKQSLLYVCRGKKYGKYPPKSFEISFIQPFVSDKSLNVLFSQYVKIVISRIKSKTIFINEIKKSKALQPIFKTNFFYALIFGPAKLNESGRKKQSEILDHLSLVKKDFSTIMKKDQRKAIDLLSDLNGNIFLIKNFDYSLLKEFDEELIATLKKEKTDLNDTNWLHSFDFHDDYLLSDFKGTFDHLEYEWDSFDSWSDSSDSGCSSCSSCSGCSGCGGCS